MPAKPFLAIAGAVVVVAVIVVGVVLGTGGGDSSDGPTGVITGTVTSGDAKPEAGVWVIAETDDLPTPYRKIVVTDDEGRFALPDLPDAQYEVWARGYGLKDSDKTAAAPGATVDVRAQSANAKEAAQVYPANYWLSLFDPPQGSGDWLAGFKLGCELCHQMGSKPTRLASRQAFDVGLKKATVMDATAEGLGRDGLLDSLADWGTRIQNGEVPKETPPRPQGIERNLVITQWAWGDQWTYAHDEISTDRRNPTLNADGPIYGVDLGNDRLLSVDPTTHEASAVKVPTRGGFDTPWCNQTYKPLPGADGTQQPPQDGGFGTLGCPAPGGTSAFVGKYHNPANPHNPMMDDQGRVWMTTQIRREWGEDLPAFCQDDPVIGNNSHHRQLGYYDPETGEIELIDTCFGTHHLQFDDKGVLWLSGDSYVLGWFDPSEYDPENPETAEQAQGYAEVSVDSDGDGKKDTPIVGFNYGIIPNPTDGSVWTAQPSVPGLITRFDPETKMFEAYAPPAPGRGPRGIDVDTEGNMWVALGGSGHLAKFDRSKCKQTYGKGDQCPEGWTLYKSPGPLMQSDPGKQNLTNADFHYYLWVDQFDTLGMGEDTVILNGTGSDSFLAFDQDTEKFTTIRVPYPMNLFTRGLDGRIDDADAGWKGRGLWFDNGLDPIIHSEVPQSYVGHIQLRPDPLAE